MKTNCVIANFAAAFFAATTTNVSPADFPKAVKFELGYSEFAPGDSITITAMHGTSSLITTNETYCVEGTYTLASHDSAELSFFSTVANSGHTRIDPKQTMHIQKGSGTFRLIKDVNQNGYLHLSFYQGNSFGGVYFGQGDWVHRDKGWGHAGGALPVPNPAGNPNAAILQYLSEPVQAPADLEAAYSKQGLTGAVQMAAKNAGVTLKKLEIEDSEFPFSGRCGLPGRRLAQIERTFAKTRWLSIQRRRGRPDLQRH